MRSKEGVFLNILFNVKNSLGEATWKLKIIGHVFTNILKDDLLWVKKKLITFKAFEIQIKQTAKK